MGIPINDIQALMSVARENDRRMAASDPELLNKIGELVDEIQNPEGAAAVEALLDEAKDYLPQRRKELAALAPAGQYDQLVNTRGRVKAAIEGEAYLDRQGELPGNVPMPIMRNGGNTRLHTEYRIDPVTDQRLVAPYMDTNDPSKVLVTELGVAPPKGIDQADEVISKKALQLMGMEVDMPSNRLEADFWATQPGAEYATTYDGMQITTGEPIEMQTHSRVAPRKRGGGLMSVPETQARLEEEMKYQGNIIDAVDNMASRGQLDQGRIAVKAGKVLRGDHSGRLDSPDQEYDRLIMPEYSREVRNAPYAQQPRNVVTAPQGIMLANLPAAYEALKSGKGGKTQVVPNFGGNNNRGRRSQLPHHKVNVVMDRDTTTSSGGRVFIDGVKAQPLLAQLLDQQTLNRIRF